MKSDAQDRLLYLLRRVEAGEDPEDILQELVWTGTCPLCGDSTA